MDREAWRAASHRVAKSQTRLSDWTELNWTGQGACRRAGRAEARGAGRRQLQKGFCSAKENVLYAEGLFIRTGKRKLLRSDQESGKIGKKHCRSQGRIDFQTKVWGCDQQCQDSPPQWNTIIMNKKVVFGREDVSDFFPLIFWGWGAVRSWASLLTVVRNPLSSAGHGIDPWGQVYPLEKEMATHSSILAWKIPWTEEPGGLQPMRLQKSQTWLSN